MKLRTMKLRTIAFIGAASLGGLGLIGVGAHAAFTTTTSSAQTINAGTPGIAVWSADATNGCTLESYGCTAVTLPTQTVGSTFETTYSTVYFENTGNIPITGISAAVTDTLPNPLYSELGMCLWSGTPVISNYLSAVESTPQTLSPGTLAVGGTGSYAADFYAGTTDTLCGAGTVPALGSGAEGQGGTVTITLTYTG